MTIEFIEQRIREQEEYLKIVSKKILSGEINMKRGAELSKSAGTQLDYFRGKLNQTPQIKRYVKSFQEFVDQTIAPCFFEDKRAAYAQEFENIMKTSTNIIH